MKVARPPAADAHGTVTTVEAAEMLGLAVRSVQLMVDRGELEGWKTPGGHRRIARTSVEGVLAARGEPRAVAPQRVRSDRPTGTRPPRLLLIEDSVHYQNLVGMLVRRQFPQVELEVASDGVTGLATYGRFEPDVLLVDILLPGIDGAAMIASMRSSPQFSGCELIVVTSLDEAQREPFAYALGGLPVVRKDRLVAELPPLLASTLERAAARAA